MSGENKEIWTSELRTRSCPLCGSNDYEIISRTMKDGINLPTVICKECTLVYTNPIPSENLYNRFYEEAYNNYYIHQEKFVPSLKGIPGDVKQIIDIISKYLPDRNSGILEIGSGSGRLLYYLTLKYPNAKGIEPGPNAANARETFRLNIIDDFFESHDFGNERFDLIIMVHVLEHFYDVRRALAKCRNLLKDNGALFVEVPNILEPFRSLDHYFLRYVHPVNYSPDTIKLMLYRHGYSVVYENHDRFNGYTPENMKVLGVKSVNVNLSSPPVTFRYKEVIKQLKLKRIQWIIIRWLPFWLVRIMNIMMARLAKSKMGKFIKNIIS